MTAARKSTNASVQNKLSEASLANKRDGSFQLQQFDSSKLELLSEADDLKQRHTEILKIEQNVNEVAELFKDLKQLVDEQKPQIEEIGENLAKAKKKVEEGHEEIIKADEYQRNRCTIL